MLVAGELLVQGSLMCGRQALSAVLGRHADAGEHSIEHPPLDLAVVRDVRQLLLLGDDLERTDDRLGRSGAEVGADPGAGPLPERLDGLDVVLGHATSLSSTMSVMRWR